MLRSVLGPTAAAVAASALLHTACCTAVDLPLLQPLPLMVNHRQYYTLFLYFHFDFGVCYYTTKPSCFVYMYTAVVEFMRHAGRSLHALHPPSTCLILSRWGGGVLSCSFRSLLESWYGGDCQVLGEAVLIHCSRLPGPLAQRMHSVYS